ncbi:MAG: hypothetical protein JXA60_02115 [Candidatus Coatesbacteria bacterium]|nr:hypothetical protein [Candidatus Coatesbacteria bacterium]
MKKCDIYDRKFIEACIMGFLDDTEKEKFMMHLSECDYCREMYEKLKEEDKAIAQLVKYEAPVALSNEIFKNIKTRYMVTEKKQFQLPLYIAATLIPLIVMSFIFLPEIQQNFVKGLFTVYGSMRPESLLSHNLFVLVPLPWLSWFAARYFLSRI